MPLYIYICTYIELYRYTNSIRVCWEWTWRQVKKPLAGQASGSGDEALQFRRNLGTPKQDTMFSLRSHHKRQKIWWGGHTAEDSLSLDSQVVG